MDKFTDLQSSIAHAAIAIVAQVITVIICYILKWVPVEYAWTYWVIGTIPGIAFYVGRELTQMEVRLQRGEPKWKKDATFDLMFPTIAVIAIAIIARIVT